MRVTCLELEVKAMGLVRPSGHEESKVRVKENVRKVGKEEEARLLASVISVCLSVLPFLKWRYN